MRDLAMKDMGFAAFFWRLARHSGRVYLAHSVTLVAYFSSRLVPGLIVQQVFDGLTGGAAARFSVGTLLGLYVGWEVGRMALNFAAEYYGRTFFYLQKALLQKNVLRGLLRRPAALPLPAPPGDALNRLDHDTGEIADFPLWLPYVAGHALFALIAVVIMLRINAVITLVVVLPLLGVILLTNAVRERLLRTYQQDREASSRVTAFLGELFGAVQAMKVADADAGVLAHFHELNEARRKAGLRVRLLQDLLTWAAGNLSDLGVGVVLLLSGGAIRAGIFTIGDFSLFITYLWFIIRFPSHTGGMLADAKTQSVSLERLLTLQDDPRAATLIEATPVYSDGRYPAIPRPPRAPADRLDVLRARGLTYRHPGTGRGIVDVDLRLERGTLTVITGEIGAGKSTLLRALLGLLPRDSGEIWWNDRLVTDAAAFFVPPRCAYTPQVPRLFSQSLRDNVLLGLPLGAEALDAAIYAGVLEADAPRLEQGLDTVVGPRGVKLSGGQVQRTAAARMFVRQPELLVFDDLSSALDVETEQELWRRLRTCAPEATVLAVSHRPAALRLADQVIEMKEGRGMKVKG